MVAKKKPAKKTKPKRAARPHADDLLDAVVEIGDVIGGAQTAVSELRGDVRRLTAEVTALVRDRPTTLTRVPFLDPNNIADAQDTKGVAEFIDGIWHKLEAAHNFGGPDDQRLVMYQDLVDGFKRVVNVLSTKALGNTNRASATVRVKAERFDRTIGTGPCVPALRRR